jgi:glycosyltransferase involved in cell wall biosynthesis
MHALQIGFFVDPERRSPDALLRDWFPLVDVAAAVASVGTRTTVVQASMATDVVERAGVTFHFVAPEAAGAALTRGTQFQALLRSLSPDVVHVHGLGFPQEVRGLRKLLPGTPILLQDHANRVPRFWHRNAFRSGAAAASGVSFCARAQAEPFRAARVLPRNLEVFEIPELTSSFTPGDAAAARSATGLRGDPALLWVAHLNANKDPLTVLDGVSAAARVLPELQLWCCYGTSPLLSAVAARVARDTRLAGRVHFLGRVPHRRVEELMRAADLFVLASHREGCNSALVEALATGLPPVVTDIPSSRELTGAGAVGALWPCGDSQALAAAIVRAAAELDPCTRARVRAHFDAHLSSTALGRKLTAAYERLLDRRTRAERAAAT